jgi:hypothetical protein
MWELLFRPPELGLAMRGRFRQYRTPIPCVNRKGHSTMDVQIRAGDFFFNAKFELEAAPKTCVLFRSLLPYRQKIIHVRWSGEGVWIPLGGLDLGLQYENATSHPAPGEIIVHPGGISETEILVAYGAVDFSSKVGQLAGNHFLTIHDDLARLRKMGEQVLWEGALDLEFK